MSEQGLEWGTIFETLILTKDADFSLTFTLLKTRTCCDYAGKDTQPTVPGQIIHAAFNNKLCEVTAR